MLHIRSCDRGVRICKRNNSVGPKVSAEREGGCSPGIQPEILLQHAERMLWYVFPCILWISTVEQIATCCLQTTPHQRRWISLKRSCGSWRPYAWILDRKCSPWREHHTGVSLLSDLWPCEEGQHSTEGPMLDQSACGEDLCWRSSWRTVPNGKEEFDDLLKVSGSPREMTAALHDQFGHTGFMYCDKHDLAT